MSEDEVELAEEDFEEKSSDDNKVRYGTGVLAFMLLFGLFIGATAFSSHKTETKRVEVLKEKPVNVYTVGEVKADAWCASDRNPENETLLRDITLFDREREPQTFDHDTVIVHNGLRDAWGFDCPVGMELQEIQVDSVEYQREIHYADKPVDSWNDTCYPYVEARDKNELHDMPEAVYEECDFQ